MAKGSILKEDVTNKILNTFPGAFRYDKEIRIPGLENGEELQIKCALTCAKVNVDPNENSNEINFGNTVVEKVENKPIEISKEEEDNINKLAEMLGF